MYYIFIFILYFIYLLIMYLQYMNDVNIYIYINMPIYILYIFTAYTYICSHIHMCISIYYIHTYVSQFYFLQNFAKSPEVFLNTSHYLAIPFATISLRLCLNDSHELDLRIIFPAVIQ